MFFLILIMDYQLLVEVAKLHIQGYMMDHKLHIQGYMMDHIADLWSHVATKYGRSDMANKWQKQCSFLNFNLEL